VDGDGTPAARLAGRAGLGKRALQGRRLAHAMIVEPCEPEITSPPRLAGALARSSRDPHRPEQGTFRDCDPRIAGACVVGAFWKRWSAAGAGSVRRCDDAQRLIDEIADGRSIVAATKHKPQNEDSMSEVATARGRTRF
jgi:hypothetical protein